MNINYINLSQSTSLFCLVSITLYDVHISTYLSIHNSLGNSMTTYNFSLAIHEALIHFIEPPDKLSKVVKNCSLTEAVITRS